MAEDTTSSCLLVDKPNTKSQVWRHFGLVSDTDGKPKEMDKPKCKLCFKEVIARLAWSVRVLISHYPLHVRRLLYYLMELAILLFKFNLGDIFMEERADAL